MVLDYHTTKSKYSLFCKLATVRKENLTKWVKPNATELNCMQKASFVSKPKIHRLQPKLNVHRRGFSGESLKSQTGWGGTGKTQELSEIFPTNFSHIENLLKTKTFWCSQKTLQTNNILCKNHDSISPASRKNKTSYR